MKLLKSISIALALCSVSSFALAQFQGQVYFRDGGVKVFANAQEQVMAWCGGFNNPQFALADLNHDGKNDLVVYERDAKQVKTFINSGTPGNPLYRYEPKYAANFPVVDEYLKLIDYNSDGIPDLFHRGVSGVRVHKGYYNAGNELSFTLYKDLYYTDTSLASLVNVSVEPSDIPAIVDVDHDGDLDIIAFWSGGTKLYFYKNLRAENNLPNDSLVFELADKEWGRTACDNHAGNCICLLDGDGDGDYDILNGNVSNTTVQYYMNGKIENSYPADTMIATDSSWQSNGHQLFTAQWPAPFLLDIDQDGNDDLLFSAHLDGSENYKCVSYYHNTGTNTSPVFSFSSDSFLTDNMIDAGTGSYPLLYDYDRDGKPDLIVGSDGYYQTSTGHLRSRLLYYKNTSVPGQASFTLQTGDFNNIFADSISGSAPAAGDLDNDGKDDLVLGQADGSIAFYPNTAASATMQPNWLHSANTQLKLTDSSGAVINVYGHAAPFIYDLNKDGKPDLIIGSEYGYLAYYENISTTPGQVKLALRNAQVGQVNPDSNTFISYSVPFIGKMDNTGNDYLLCGSNSGNIYRYDGFQTGNTNISYLQIDSMYSFLNDGPRSAPAVADIDGDGKYEMIIGNLKGGLTIYSQNQFAGINASRFNSSSAKDVYIYPNPAKDRLYFSWNKSFAQEAGVQIAIYTVTGQKMLDYSVPYTQQGSSVTTQNLPSGLYFCEVRSGANKSVLQMLVLK